MVCASAAIHVINLLSEITLSCIKQALYDNLQDSQDMKFVKHFILWYELAMSMTVAELSGIPDFRIQVLAGSAGTDRRIAWAHVCELPDPTEWLSRDELLMTVGFSIPEGSAAQEAYIERLAAAGLSGLMICDQMYAPDLSKEMLVTANKYSLPVLLTAHEVPFSTIVRTVAEANRSNEYERLSQILRLYETVRRAISGFTGSEIMDQLGKLVECDLLVLDPYRGCSLLGRNCEVPTEVATALIEETTHCEKPIPAIMRLDVAGRSVAALLVPASRPATLVTIAESADLPDLSILHHITAIAALEVEKLVVEYERKRRLGAELLAGFLDGRIGADSATRLLSEWQLTEEPRVLACCTGDGETGGHSDLHLRLADRRIPHLMVRRAPVLTALLPDTSEAIRVFCSEMGSSVPVGLSDPLGTISRIPDAYREAQWAFQGAAENGKPVARYGEDADLSPFLPRSLSEAESAVQRVLGPILAYDATHDSQLTATLKEFLSRNRSWRRTAEALHVHKQSLVYRIRRVEELTGRRLDRTGDVAEFWLAFQAAERSGTDICRHIETKSSIGIGS